MDALANSNHYTLEYPFCQGEMLGLGNKVVAAGGICWILTMDWLEGKLNNKAFVASARSIEEKYLQSEKIAANGGASWAVHYKRYKPNLQLGNSRDLKFDVANCRACINLIGNGQAVALHLGEGLQSNSGSHLIAVVKLGGVYHMFDPNFGCYSSNSAANCARWVTDVCNHKRKNGRVYANGITHISPVVFS